MLGELAAASRQEEMCGWMSVRTKRMGSVVGGAWEMPLVWEEEVVGRRVWLRCFSMEGVGPPPPAQKSMKT